jgi:hypothetical protein
MRLSGSSGSFQSMRLADLIHKYQLLEIDPTYYLLEGSPRFKIA